MIVLPAFGSLNILNADFFIFQIPFPFTYQQENQTWTPLLQLLLLVMRPSYLYTIDIAFPFFLIFTTFVHFCLFSLSITGNYSTRHTKSFCSGIRIEQSTWSALKLQNVFITQKIAGIATLIFRNNKRMISINF